MARILETRRLTPVTKYFLLDAPLIAASAKPGQFVMLRVREGGERIPITIADYDRALLIDPRYVGAWVNRGIARRQQGDADGAIEDFDEALQIDPGSANAWCGRAYAEYGRSKWPEALESFLKARRFGLSAVQDAAAALRIWLLRGKVGEDGAATEELRKTFRPEFLNRLDETVFFRRLEKEQIRSIVDIQLARFAERLARRDLGVEVTDRAKDLLAEVGWDPQFGARPLRRAIQRYVEDPLAKRVIAGEFPPGTRIDIDRTAAGDLSFTPRVQN